MYRLNNDLEGTSSPRSGRPSDGDLPAESPLAMPVQDFSQPPEGVQPEPLAYFGPLVQRRLFLVVGSFLFGLLAAQEMFTPLQADGIDTIDAGFFLLFFGLFAWIAFGFLNAVAGLFVLLGRGPVVAAPDETLVLPKTRTAVLRPARSVSAVGARARPLASCSSVAARSFNSRGAAAHTARSSPSPVS